MLIEFFDGNSWSPAPGDTVVTFTWTGPNPPVVSDLPGPDALSCTLRTDGTCTVTVDSDVVANATITLQTITAIAGNPVPPINIADADQGGGTVATRSRTGSRSERRSRRPRPIRSIRRTRSRSAPSSS